MAGIIPANQDIPYSERSDFDTLTSVPADAEVMIVSAARPAGNKEAFISVSALLGGPTAVNDIGTPNSMGFGVGICPSVPAGFSELIGTRDRLHDNYGNYIHNASGSIMAWVPAYYIKYGNGANGLPINAVDIKPWSFFTDPAQANANGYVVERAFYNGGTLQQGFFYDKFFASNNGSGVAASIKNGIPLSSSPANNGFATLNGAPANNYGEAVAAAKTRGTDFFCSTRFMRISLAKIALAQAWFADGPHVCAWIDEDGITSFPKGCNNNALGDINDPMVVYLGTGYLNAPRTGSATHFARTTHNGQANGVADLNGCMQAIEIGLTSNNTNFFALRTSVDVKTLTAGNTLATDAWGAAGIAANYDDLGGTFRVLNNSVLNKPYGNAAQMFSNNSTGNAWQGDGLGIPLVSGGTNLFGSDFLYDFRLNDLCPVSGGTWSANLGAGIWAWTMNTLRDDSRDLAGFRCARYL
jgi:hypothetical protein